MPTATANLALLRNEIVADLTNAVVTLNRMAATTINEREVQRLTAKSAAVQQVISDQGERLSNVQVIEHVFIIIQMIKLKAIESGANEAGTALAIDYICRLIR